MALCRIKAVEQLQYQPPGELGKLLGLDRVPEVRCLRHKLASLSLDDAPGRWAGLLSKDWLEAAPELAGTLYVDGHVRLYHGDQTALPKRYVSRQRLCLRGTTDYWVNDVLGQPFFAVERPIDHGLLEVLRSDIVPRLLETFPANRVRRNSKPTAIVHALSSCSTAKGTARNSSRRCGRHTASLASPTTNSPRTIGRPPSSRNRNDAAQRRAGVAETGRAGRLDRRQEEGTLDAGDPQADRERAPGQPGQHGLRRVGTGGFCPAVQSMVPGKLPALHDATLCYRPT